MLYLQEIRQHVESEKINKIHSENNRFIINNNSSSSEQTKIQTAFTELRETVEQIFFFINLQEFLTGAIHTEPARGIKPHSSPTYRQAGFKWQINIKPLGPEQKPLLY